MHEQTLAKSLLRQVDEVRRAHEAAAIAEIRVEAGPLSGVEPALLISAFSQLAAQTPAAGASLVIEELPLMAQCRGCGRQFEAEGVVLRCPDCQGPVRVVRGEDLTLLSVTVADAIEDGSDSL